MKFGLPFLVLMVAVLGNIAVVIAGSIREHHSNVPTPASPHARPPQCMELSGKKSLTDGR